MIDFKEIKRSLINFALLVNLIVIKFTVTLSLIIRLAKK